MTREEFITNVAPTIKNGTYRKITYQSDLLDSMKATDKKNHQAGDLIKITRSVVRLGVAYSHMQAVAAQIAAEGVTEAVDLQLPWGQWDPECKYLIEHKGNYYLRCAVHYCPQTKAKSVYYYKGVEISKEELQMMGILRDSYWTKPAPETVFTMPLSKVISL